MDTGVGATDIPSKTARVTGIPKKPGRYVYSLIVQNDGHKLVHNFIIDAVK